MRIFRFFLNSRQIPPYVRMFHNFDVTPRELAWEMASRLGDTDVSINSAIFNVIVLLDRAPL